MQYLREQTNAYLHEHMHIYLGFSVCIQWFTACGWPPDGASVCKYSVKSTYVRRKIHFNGQRKWALQIKNEMNSHEHE